MTLDQPVTLDSDDEEDLAENAAAWKEIWRKRTTSGGLAHSRLTDRPSSALEQQGPLVRVNVGGTIFNTTAETLRKAPFFDSMLRHVQDGLLGTPLDEGGHIFIDRPPELFGTILAFLRSGRWSLDHSSHDVEFIGALRQEASFYGLDDVRDQFPLPMISEYVTLWQFHDDMSLYVDCMEQTIREDPDHQGLFRLCKYSGGLPLDQQTCTKRFKATSQSVQSVLAYFATRGFALQKCLEGSIITHTTSADGLGRIGHGTQHILVRKAAYPIVPLVT